MFPQLSTPLNITLTVIIAIVALWLLAFLIAELFILFFKSALRRHSKSMMVLLNAKYENLQKVYDLFKEYNVEVDPKLVETLNKIDVKTFEKQDSKEAEEARNLLAYLRDEANYIANRNKDLLEKPDFAIARNNVLELDIQYRNNIALYNADVLGYNYWIAFLPVRFIFKIFKAKKKDIIG